jgi:putrescine transport system substrate-binding protein
VSEVLPGVAVNSWRLIFDPVLASKLAKCGINLIDNPAAIVRLVLKYLGRDPNSQTPKDLADAEAALLKIRPYIRTIDSSIGTDAMANGDVCMAVDANGVVFLARNRAREAKNEVELAYAIPEEGSLLWFDMLAIPKDAPHPLNGLLLMNYLMEPQVAATNAKGIGNASANAAALPQLDASFAADPMIYPTPGETQRLFVQTEDPQNKLVRSRASGRSSRRDNSLCLWFLLFDCLMAPSLYSTLPAPTLWQRSTGIQR